MERTLKAPPPPRGVPRRTALITGSSSGIGIAIGRQLGAMGFNVGLTRMPNEDPKAVTELVQQVTTVYGVEAEVFVVDLSDAAPASRMLVTEHVKRFGRLDVLVNNAGWAAFAPSNFMDLGETTEEVSDKFRRGFAVNFEAAVLLSWEAVRQFRKQSPPDASDKIIDANSADLNQGFYGRDWGTGRIINTSSVHGETPIPFSSIYTCAKHALNGLTKYLAYELGREGVTVNGVAPGLVATPQTLIDPNDVELRENYQKGLFIPRPGRPTEISALVAFLVSQGGRYTTAQTITVDGGFTTTNPQLFWMPNA